MAQVAVTKAIPQPVSLAPGKGVTEALRHTSQVYKSDNVGFADTTTVNLFELPGSAVIIDLFVHVTSVFDPSSGTAGAAATASITVPNDTGTQTVWNAEGTKLQSTGSTFASVALGVVVPDSGGFIAMSYTPGTTTAGQLEVYVVLAQPDTLL